MTLRTITGALFGDDPEVETLFAEETAVLLPSRVLLYNDEIHTFDEVILQLMKATGCTMMEAEGFAFEVDSRGLACVYEGEMGECLRVSSVLEEIALHTEIEF
jgi:ATP-dependent Clp protease adaptor protein ClpS